MEFSVKTVTGKTITLKVEASDSIDDLETSIKFTGKTITLELKSPVPFQPDITQGRVDKIPPNVNSLDPREPDSIQILVQIASGKAFNLKVKRSDKIEMVKALVYAHEGIPIQEQHLMFRQTFLSDDKRLADYDIISDSNVFLFRRPLKSDAMQILVQIVGGKTFTLEVKISYKINMVKAMIYSIEGFPTQEQHLMFRQRFLSDDKRLADYDIVNDSKLFLFCRPVNSGGKSIADLKRGGDSLVDKPKRPAGGYYVFMEEFRKQYKEKYPNNKSSSGVVKAGSDKWQSMSVEKRAPFIATANKRMQEYERKMEAYNKKLAGGADGESDEMSGVNGDNDDEDDD